MTYMSVFGEKPQAPDGIYIYIYTQANHSTLTLN